MGILTKQFIERSKDIKELKKAKVYREDGERLYLLSRPKGNYSWYL
ncbi:hypothetical protein [Francisella halioticida]|nr:hypothetical protein [Francisella halioticida]